MIQENTMKTSEAIRQILVTPMGVALPPGIENDVSTSNIPLAIVLSTRALRDSLSEMTLAIEQLRLRVSSMEQSLHRVANAVEQSTPPRS